MPRKGCGHLRQGGRQRGRPSSGAPAAGRRGLGGEAVEQLAERPLGVSGCGVVVAQNGADYTGAGSREGGLGTAPSRRSVPWRCIVRSSAIDPAMKMPRLSNCAAVRPAAT